MIVLWLDSNTEHKGWSRRTPLTQVGPKHPPQYGRLTAGGGKESRKKAQRETTSPPALRLQFNLLLSAFLHVHPLKHTETSSTSTSATPTHAAVKTCGAETVAYLLGAVACTEKLFWKLLELGTGVVVDQVLLQVLHHPEHQRTAVPLSTRHRR